PYGSFWRFACYSFFITSSFIRGDTVLNKKLVEILGWLQQANEMLERCQEDTSRTRAPKSSMYTKEITHIVELIKEDLKSIQERIDKVAQLFVFVEGLSGAGTKTYSKELDWPLQRLISAFSPKSHNGRQK